jgi:DNA primase
MYGGSTRDQTDIYTESQIRNALGQVGIRIASEITSHFIVFCVYHHNDSTPAGEVDKETGQFYCFSCRSTTDLVHLVMKAGGLTYFRARRLIGENDYNIVDVVNKNLEEEAESFDQSIIDRLHSQVWGDGSAYLHLRGISDGSISAYQLGYSDRQGMVTTPIHTSSGNLAGFVGRSIKEKRFKNNRGLQKSRLLFNLHKVWTNSSVYVVESCFDAIRLGQVGKPAVATLGASVSNEQIRMLKRSFDEITLIPDKDNAGMAMTMKIQEFIPHMNIFILPDHAHDVGDCSNEQLHDMLG